MSDAAMCLHKEFVHICPVVAQRQGEWVRTRGRHWIRVCVCARGRKTARADRLKRSNLYKFIQRMSDNYFRIPQYNFGCRDDLDLFVLIREIYCLYIL